jgi:hypothetical protein
MNTPILDIVGSVGNAHQLDTINTRAGRGQVGVVGVGVFLDDVHTVRQPCNRIVCEHASSPLLSLSDTQCLVDVQLY